MSGVSLVAVTYNAATYLPRLSVPPDGAASNRWTRAAGATELRMSDFGLRI